MFFRSTVWLGLSVFLFTLLGAGLPAESQAPLKNKTTTSREPTKDLAVAVIDGFRSAKFGMDEKQVFRAITKDFNFSKSKVERLVSSKEKITTLTIQHPKLMKIGGPAAINYGLGYKSKRLTQIVIEWGKRVNNNYSAKEIISIGNVLRNHFLKKSYKRTGFAFNKPQPNHKRSIILFRGLDKKGRMIVLRLQGYETKKGDKKHAKLILIYHEKPSKQDIFQRRAK
jgi:hypothetical protein